MTWQQHRDRPQPQGCADHANSRPLHYVAYPPLQRAPHPPTRQQGALNSYTWILFHTWFPILFRGFFLQSDLSISPSFRHFRPASGSRVGSSGVAVLTSSSWRHYTIWHSLQPVDLNELLVSSGPIIRLKYGGTQSGSRVRQTIQQKSQGLFSEI